jgi:hypothetical protein
MRTSGRFATALLGWGLLGAGLGSVLMLQLRPEDGQDAPPATASAAAAWIPAAPAPVATGADPTGAWASTILARPLFEPQRRPPAAPAMAEVSEPAAQELPRLTGVLTGPFGRIAIFANPEGGRPLVVAQGDRINGFLVQTVGLEEAKLLGPDGLRVARTGFGDPETAGRIAIAVAEVAASTTRAGGSADAIPPSFSGGQGEGGSAEDAATKPPEPARSPAGRRTVLAEAAAPPAPDNSPAGTAPVAERQAEPQAEAPVIAALPAAAPEAASEATPVGAPPAPTRDEPQQVASITGTMSPATMQMLVRRGDEMFRLGDISAARQFYSRAAAAGSGAAATAMGKTYDPAVLARIGARGMLADPLAADFWYKRATQLGDGAPERVASR